MIASPCIKVCVMDAEQRYCVGCRRTLHEIARWAEMSDAERVAVLAGLAPRRAASGEQAAVLDRKKPGQAA